MTQTASALTQTTLGHHLDCFGRGDMDGILEDYTPESVLLTPTGIVRGKDELRGFFAGMFAEFGKPGMSFNMLSQSVDGDVAQIIWSAETADNSYEYASDTFVMENGKITAQTLAAKVTPKS
jgi:ketosteroid isomerase-like protein